MFKKISRMIFVAFLAFALSAPTVTMAADGPNHTPALFVFMAAVAVIATGGGALIAGGASAITTADVAWPAVVGAVAAGGASVQQYSRK